MIKNGELTGLEEHIQPKQNQDKNLKNNLYNYLKPPLQYFLHATTKNIKGYKKEIKSCFF